MADEDDTAVALGEGRPVEGAPLARVAARLMWGIEKSAIVDREGDTVIRTPDGPRDLADVLDEVEQPYFPTQQAFEDAVRAVVGTGPVPTADSDDESADGETTAEEDVDADADADADAGADADADAGDG